MAFKGSIPKGSRIEAQLQVSNTAAGSALLAISNADNGGAAGSDASPVAPAASGRVGVQTSSQSTGIVRILADFNSDSDTGQLTVLVNGGVHSTEAVRGDTSWSFTLT
jgi:hypothetical protein